MCWVVWFSGCGAVEIEVCTGLGSFFICNGVAGPSGFQVRSCGDTSARACGAACCCGAGGQPDIPAEGSGIAPLTISPLFRPSETDCDFTSSIRTRMVEFWAVTAAVFGSGDFTASVCTLTGKFGGFVGGVAVLLETAVSKVD